MSHWKINDYKIGLFGIGVDGHTAGIMPPDTISKWTRISITPQLIKKLDEIVLYVEGKEKIKILQKLDEDIDEITMPAQLLKSVPKLTIFYLQK